MSNKKSQKKAAKPVNSNAGEKTTEKKGINKSTRNILIAAAAVVVVAAAVLIGVFAVKPAIEKSKEPATFSVEGGSSNEGESYTYIDYNGVRMPKEFAEVLNQAAIDSKKACDEYGVALKVGDREISTPEFVFYYIDQYYVKVGEVETSKSENNGENRTGYDPLVLPDAQQCLNKGYTWAENFTQKAIENMIYYYEGFDKAMEAGIQFTEDEISQIISIYSRIDEYSKTTKKEPEELLKSTYADGLTYPMFKAREIMRIYTERYESNKKNELYDSYSDEFVKSKLDANVNDYTVVKARVYPIEGVYDEDEVAKITNEKEFLDYANGNYPGQGYNAEITTQCFYTRHSTIEDVYGEVVADWIFDPARKPGEVGVVEDFLFRYVIYIEKLPFLNTSCNVLIFENAVDSSTMNAEQIEESRKSVEEQYEEWKKNGASKEDFIKLCENSDYGAERLVRNGAYSYEINNWLLDDSRKAGDSAYFYDDDGVYIFYYLQKNTDDYDWDVYIRTEQSQSDYDALYEEAKKEDYSVKRYDSDITKGQKSANVRITEKINEAKAKEES